MAKPPRSAVRGGRAEHADTLRFGKRMDCFEFSRPNGLASVQSESQSVIPRLAPTGQLVAALCLGQLGLLVPFECELVLLATSYASSGVFQSRPREAQLSAK